MSRTSTILLLSDDYADRLDALYERAVQLEGAEDPERPSTRRLGEPTPLEAARAEYEALRAEAEQVGTKVVLRALGRKEWRALKVKHPARAEGDADALRSDRAAGVNVDTVEDDLVYAALVEPEFPSRAAYDEWADQLPEADFQTILVRAWQLVNVARVDPKSLAASPTRSSGATSS